MEFKGTKGKWYWVYYDNTQMASLMSDIGEEVCNFGDCTTYYPTEGVEPNSYDALLISKAPEMLEMLKYIFECKNEYDEIILDMHRVKEIEQLIKEATEL